MGFGAGSRAGVSRQWGAFRAELGDLQDEDGRPRLQVRDDSQGPRGCLSSGSAHPGTEGLREGVIGRGGGGERKSSVRDKLSFRGQRSTLKVMSSQQAAMPSARQPEAEHSRDGASGSPGTGLLGGGRGHRLRPQSRG